MVEPTSATMAQANGVAMEAQVEPWEGSSAALKTSSSRGRFLRSRGSESSSPEEGGDGGGGGAGGGGGGDGEVGGGGGGGEVGGAGEATEGGEREGVGSSAFGGLMGGVEEDTALTGSQNGVGVPTQHFT